MNPSCLRQIQPSTTLFSLNAARGLSLFIGSFALVRTLAIRIAGNHPGHPGIWWGDMRSQPIPIRVMATGLFGIMMLGFSIPPIFGMFRKNEMGPNSEAPLANSLEMLRSKQVLGWAIAAIEFYHLSQIKTACLAHGKKLFTLTAWPSHPARKIAFRSAPREVPSFRACFARPVSDHVST
jgi:hypothetical protein